MVVPHGNIPCVFGARLKIEAEVLDQNTLRTFRFAGIPDRFAATLHFYPVRSLHSPGAVSVQFPAETRLYLVKPQRLALIFNRQIV